VNARGDRAALTAPRARQGQICNTTAFQTRITTTWSNGQGDVRFFTRADGSRLPYYTAGTGTPLALLWGHYTVYALDLPGMGWSDIVPGATYEEPELRAAVVEFTSGLNLHGITLAGESLGAALALSASKRSKRQGEPCHSVQQLRLPQWTVVG